MIFSKLAKMTVENLCKTPQISNRNAPIAPSKMATYDNFQVNCHKKRAIFEETPTLHFGVKVVVTFLDIIKNNGKSGKYHI